MDMDGSKLNNSTMMMMVPWLHFTSGDYLYFKSWKPNSSGAIAGAAVGLFFLALFDRWLAAVRGVMELHWQRRTLALMSKSFASRTSTPLSPSSGTKVPVKDDILADTQEVMPNPQPKPVYPPLKRTVAPFVPAHDFTRGVMHALQSLLVYLLMLAVMTFQAVYIIVIVLGLGLGEVLFGRMGSINANAH